MSESERPAASNWREVAFQQQLAAEIRATVSSEISQLLAGPIVNHDGRVAAVSLRSRF